MKTLQSLHVVIGFNGQPDIRAMHFFVSNGIDRIVIHETTERILAGLPPAVFIQHGDQFCSQGEDLIGRHPLLEK